MALCGTIVVRKSPSGMFWNAFYKGPVDETLLAVRRDKISIIAEAIRLLKVAGADRSQLEVENG